jgi:hypothetical protein
MQALNTPVSPAVDTATMRMIFPGVPVRKMVTIPQTIEANIVIVEIIAIARHAFTEAGKKIDKRIQVLIFFKGIMSLDLEILLTVFLFCVES